MYLRLAFFVVLNFLEGETIEIMRRILNNQDIRDLMSEYGFRQYEVADKIGIDVSTLVRWLQLPLTPDHRIRVFKAIKELQEEEHKKQLAVKQWFEQQYGNAMNSDKGE